VAKHKPRRAGRGAPRARLTSNTRTVQAPIAGAVPPAEKSAEGRCTTCGERGVHSGWGRRRGGEVDGPAQRGVSLGEAGVLALRLEADPASHALPESRVVRPNPVEDPESERECRRGATERHRFGQGQSKHRRASAALRGCLPLADVGEKVVARAGVRRRPRLCVAVVYQPLTDTSTLGVGGRPAPRRRSSRSRRGATRERFHSCLGEPAFAATAITGEVHEGVDALERADGDFWFRPTIPLHAWGRPTGCARPATSTRRHEEMRRVRNDESVAGRYRAKRQSTEPTWWADGAGGGVVPAVGGSGMAGGSGLSVWLMCRPRTRTNPQFTPPAAGRRRK